MKSAVKKIVITAMLASLTCVATMIRVPLPLAGYVNLGDGIVLLSGWLLSAPYGFLAAGIGSALADIFAGYVTYVPVTFVIKGLMALIAFYGVKVLVKVQSNTFKRVLCGLAAELVMVAGYYTFEGFMYGFIPSLASVPFNALQGAVGLLLGVLLVKVFDRVKIFHLV